MSQDRRKFLKMFGVSSAVVVSAAGGPEVLTIPETEARPIDVGGPGSTLVDMRRFMDVVDSPIYDKLTIPKNEMKHNHLLFQNPYGKSYAETNLMNAGKLDAPETKLLRSIGITFAPNTIRGLRNAFIDRYALHLWIGQKLYLTAPLADLFTEDHGSPQDEPNLRGRLKLEIPLLITHEASWYVQLTGHPIAVHPKLSLYCTWWGPFARGVQ